MIACGSVSANVETAPNDLRVIDGDTISADGKHYRLIGFDAPETGVRARCSDEARRGRLATSRLRDIVKSKTLSLVRIACTCRHGEVGTPACNYGRRCGVLFANGKDVAETMIVEGLARSYICAKGHCPQRSDWCATTDAQ